MTDSSRVPAPGDGTPDGWTPDVSAAVYRALEDGLAAESVVKSYGLQSLIANRLHAKVKAALAAAVPPAAPSDFAWLIEDGTPGGRYYAGVEWTTDHMKAIRYARREDAERAVMGLPNGWHLIGRAVEHGWAAVPPAAAQPRVRWPRGASETEITEAIDAARAAVAPPPAEYPAVEALRETLGAYGFMRAASAPPPADVTEGGHSANVTERGHAAAQPPAERGWNPHGYDPMRAPAAQPGDGTPDPRAVAGWLSKAYDGKARDDERWLRVGRVAIEMLSPEVPAGAAAAPSDWKKETRSEFEAVTSAILDYKGAVENPEASILDARVRVLEAVMDLCEKVAACAVAVPPAAAQPPAIPYRGEADEHLLALARKYLFLTGPTERGYEVNGWATLAYALAHPSSPDPDERAAAQPGERAELADMLAEMPKWVDERGYLKVTDAQAARIERAAVLLRAAQPGERERDGLASMALAAELDAAWWQRRATRLEATLRRLAACPYYENGDAAREEIIAAHQEAESLLRAAAPPGEEKR